MVTAKERAMMRKMALAVQRWREPTKHYEGDFAAGYDMGSQSAADTMDELMSALFGAEWRAIQSLTAVEGVKGEG